MPKTVKLQDNVYNQLTGLMGPKETYSQVVERLLAIRLIAGGLSEALQSGMKLKAHTDESVSTTTHPNV